MHTAIPDAKRINSFKISPELEWIGGPNCYRSWYKDKGMLILRASFQLFCALHDTPRQRHVYVTTAHDFRTAQWEDRRKSTQTVSSKAGHSTRIKIAFHEVLQLHATFLRQTNGAESETACSTHPASPVSPLEWRKTRQLIPILSYWPFSNREGEHTLVFLYHNWRSDYATSTLESCRATPVHVKINRVHSVPTLAGLRLVAYSCLGRRRVTTGTWNWIRALLQECPKCFANGTLRLSFIPLLADNIVSLGLSMFYARMICVFIYIKPPTNNG
jgi:hypothetical protein